MHLVELTLVLFVGARRLEPLESRLILPQLRVGDQLGVNVDGCRDVVTIDVEVQLRFVVVQQHRLDVVRPRRQLRRLEGHQPISDAGVRVLDSRHPGPHGHCCTLWYFFCGSDWSVRDQDGGAAGA